jgi:hypothetical protein
MGIIAAGILSRVVHTGAPLFDKYLGDALYAAMVYAILRSFRPNAEAAIAAMAIMIVIELFQLTMIPARLLGSDSLVVRMVARLMGTKFGWLDLIAYAAGVLCMRLTAR